MASGATAGCEESMAWRKDDVQRRGGTGAVRKTETAKSSNTGTAGGRAVDPGADAGDSAETFLEKMRPEGEADTPAFVQRLKEGALDAAEDFWR